VVSRRRHQRIELRGQPAFVARTVLAHTAR
jgi:hypothetical protein